MLVNDRTLNVLVVEDHDDTRKMLKMFLELLGHRCEVAEDTGVAISRASEGAFDALLTDVHMPGRNGFDLVQQLRESKCLPLLVISMSAGVVEQEATRSKAAGCHAHLLKPFPLTELEVALALAHP